MCTGRNDKVGLRTAVHLFQRLHKGLTNHFVRPGFAQAVSVFFAVIHCENGQPQQFCQTGDGGGHMSASADDQLRHSAKAFCKHLCVPHLQYAGGGDILQRPDVLQQKITVPGLPDRLPVA